jgi:hypothetical protein
VQAQDYAGAKWALGLRLKDSTDASIDQAFADGSLLRIHLLRPTWHFVSPTDIRWLLMLTAEEQAIRKARKALENLLNLNVQESEHEQRKTRSV